MKARDLAIEFVWLCKLAKLPEPLHGKNELVFAPPRKFRFDACWPDLMLAVEIHGGVWIHGRHNTGKGLTADCVKTRLAVLRGWRVLPFTGTELKQEPLMVIETVKAAMENTRCATNTNG